MGPTIHLVDASPYIFRAYHSLPRSIRDPEGRSVNAVYGFAGFLARLIGTDRPSHLALCFDGSLTKSFRNEIYAPYKAQREPPPEDLEAQLTDCRAIAEAVGAAIFVDASFEADDLIATLLERTRDAAGHTVVVSSDKDLAQLVKEEVTLWDFARDERLDPEGVERRLGVRPEQVPDLLGLAGDSVDNIPGVRGVGPKTAVRLLRSFEDLEEILASLDRVAELPLRGARSIADRLEAQADTARLSRELATVSVEAPVGADLTTLRYFGPDAGKLSRICERLGFERLQSRLEALP